MIRIYLLCFSLTGCAADYSCSPGLSGITELSRESFLLKQDILLIINCKEAI